MQSLQAICLVRAAHLHGTQSLQWPLRRHPACSAKQQEVTGLPNEILLFKALLGLEPDTPIVFAAVLLLQGPPWYECLPLCTYMTSDTIAITVAILAQGTSRADAVTQAFFGSER